MSHETQPASMTYSYTHCDVTPKHSPYTAINLLNQSTITPCGIWYIIVHTCVNCCRRKFTKIATMKSYKCSSTLNPVRPPHQLIPILFSFSFRLLKEGSSKVQISCFVKRSKIRHRLDTLWNSACGPRGGLHQVQDFASGRSVQLIKTQRGDIVRVVICNSATVRKCRRC